MGSTIPFPATREGRAAKSDPRRSIEERYPSRARYLEQVRHEAQRLVDEGYLLAEDLELVVGQASRRYELLAAAVQETVAAGE
jgi:NACalpha-BTF3-like transcription factor